MRTVWQHRYYDGDNVYSLRIDLRGNWKYMKSRSFARKLKCLFVLDRIILFGAKFVCSFIKAFPRLIVGILLHVYIPTCSASFTSIYSTVSYEEKLTTEKQFEKKRKTKNA